MSKNVKAQLVRLTAAAAIAISLALGATGCCNEDGDPCNDDADCCSDCCFEVLGVGTCMPLGSCD